MRNQVLGIFVVAAVALGPYAASASKIIILSGTHSESEVKNDCANVGGRFLPSDGSSYGCVKNGNSVSCNTQGKCTGEIKRATGPSRPTFGGVLGSRPVGRVIAKRNGTTFGHASTGRIHPTPPKIPPMTARRQH